jgi:polyribonucleotide nucleotidyltransferase
MLPDKERFPYTIRLTSEILESNGSSSMATVCGGTLALMDAGVPITQPVAGVAMGLVKEGSRVAILSDILGSEDHCGDMDFKVAGTGRGITALQMDIKCEGLSRDIFARALEQAREGRKHVLQEMLKALRRPRQEVSPNAPRLITLKIPVDKIGLVIGPSGKMIRGLQEEFTVKINIENDGTVTVAGASLEKVDACVKRIKDMTAEVEVGAVYKGRVSAIKEFGAFVEILPGQEGLVHVSELSHEFIRSVTDVVRIGDELEVKVIAIDDFGKVKLSRRALLAATTNGEGAGGGRRPERGEGRLPRDDRGQDEPRGPRHEHAPGGERGFQDELAAPEGEPSGVETAAADVPQFEGERGFGHGRERGRGRGHGRREGGFGHGHRDRGEGGFGPGRGGGGGRGRHGHRRGPR